MKIAYIFLAILTVVTVFKEVESLADDGTKYEVTIRVVYNAVDIKEANKIMTDAIKRHQEACKVEVEAKKVGGDYLNITDFDWSNVTATQDSVELHNFIGRSGD